MSRTRSPFRHFAAVAVGIVLSMQTANAADKAALKTSVPDETFFKHCAFVSIDFQEGTPTGPIPLDQMPALWRKMGFSLADVNAANAFARDVALPNAVKVADACRRLNLPMIFVHWGYLCADAMDLDPDIRKTMFAEHGTDYGKYSGYIGQPGSRVAKAFAVRPGDYVLPKAAQDAFQSCNIQFVLRNLQVRNIIFVGGHTGACLGRTAKSAIRLGYVTLCIQDATNNARESTREKEIEETGYAYVMNTAKFLDFAQRAGSVPRPKPADSSEEGL